MGRLARSVLVVAFVLAGTGCASIPERTKHELEQPLDCEHLDLQVARLSRDHAAPGQRLIAGIQGVFPLSVVISLVRDVLGKPRGIYMDHWRVAFGTYNERIEHRLDALHLECEQGGSGDAG